LAQALVVVVALLKEDITAISILQLVALVEVDQIGCLLELIMPAVVVVAVLQALVAAAAQEVAALVD
jgi:hypothetical protein